MNDSGFIRESACFEEFGKFLELSQRLRNMFEAAGMPMPPPLARVFDTSKGKAQETQLQAVVPPPKSPERPVEARPDWIWVRGDALTEMTLSLGIIRSAAGPIKMSAILEEAKRWNPDVVSGSLYNAIAKLRKEGKIEGSDTGYQLRNGALAPVLHGDYAWGSTAMFQMYELAAHRREVVLHLLRMNKTAGLMQSQILHMLKADGVCTVAANKDLVKGDFSVLREEKKVKRVGGSKKWTVDED